MDFMILFVNLVIMLQRVRSQDPRCVSIFDDKDEISNSGIIMNNGISGCRGKKGERGIPGKAGISGPPGQKGNQGIRGSPGINGAAGIKGLPGTKGNQGVKGESGSTDGTAAFQQKIQNLITGSIDFDRSLSLLESKLNAAMKRIDDLTPPVSCSQSGKTGSQILSSGERVYCHQQWRVIQRRFNGQVIFHNRTWNEYKNGFGSLSTEFWIGLDNIHRLTRNRGCKLRVELGAFDGSEAYAEYREFSIGSESDLLRLHISGYSGTAGDSMKNNNNMTFTTIDRDNDGLSSGNCAALQGGGRGAWWFNSCGYARLNGRWEENLNTYYSFAWWHWKNAWITLKSSMMMIRCD